MEKRPHVFIIGAGFGGLQTAQSLASHNIDVTLIDRNNYHTFVPLLYQVATGQLAPEQVIVPIRSHLRSLPNMHFLREEVQHINYDRQLVITNNRTIFYDYLVLATGSKSNFFGVKGAKEYAFTLKTINDSVRLRNHLLDCFEKAESECDPLIRQKLLTISIVGGGATGIEMAGALWELLTTALQRDYRRLAVKHVTIAVFQSSDRLMAEFPKSLGDYTLKKLRKLGIKVMLNCKAEQVCDQGIAFRETTESSYSEKLRIDCSTVIWAVGGGGAIPQTTSDLSITEKRQQLEVLPTLQLINYPQVFAIGDVANAMSQGKPLSGVAPEALQQGVYVAKSIKKHIQGKPLKPFNYFNKGRFAIIGSYVGIGKIGFLKLRGFIPWFAWLAVHWVYFPDWRNRFLILLTWLHNYLLGDRNVRLILSSPQLAKEKSTINH